ncbi:hypothetical protein L3Y34_009736 [Caenorhabditis briggsae]|uniref:Uncharacterized protein n=1 Tax=Caenorhabditis briggsae TaxID=6238 RepID=A0AAE9AAS8_CAEBR|nr:hypothetical protein L3Y34_009736 [Caenorhabditis briggsae]
MLSRCLCPRRKKSGETIIVTADEANHGHMKSISATPNQTWFLKSPQVFQILRYVKTEELGVRQPNCEADLSEEKRTLRFDEIPKFETYENIRDIRVFDFVMTNPVLDFLDKPVLLMRRVRVSRDDILSLKQAFLTNPYFKRWQLQYEDSEGDDMIHNILGRIPHEEQEKWFYGIPNSTEVLCIQSVYQTGLDCVFYSN